MYSDLVYAALSRAARAALEEMMDRGTWQWKSPFAKKYVALGRAEGKAEGKAEALLEILAARSMGVTDEQRALILACGDLETLDRWIARSLDVTSTSQLLS